MYKAKEQNCHDMKVVGSWRGFHCRIHDDSINRRMEVLKTIFMPLERHKRRISTGDPARKSQFHMERFGYIGCPIFTWTMKLNYIPFCKLAILSVQTFGAARSNIESKSPADPWHVALIDAFQQAFQVIVTNLVILIANSILDRTLLLRHSRS